MRSGRPPLWTGLVIGLLAGLALGLGWLLLREREARAGDAATAVAAPAPPGQTVGPAAAGVAAAAPVAAVAPVDEALHGSRRNAIVRATERVSPAVVSLNVIHHRTYRTHAPGLEFWEYYFPGMFPRREFRQDVQSLGSGFIVSSDGYILTNDHVVEDADEIRVILADGRQFAAEHLASASNYDLALLKVDARGLPAAPLASDHQLYIGEWAIAIGSPFGFLLADTQPTVTVGVISALNRDIKRQSAQRRARNYLGMIQTDAAINPGNSGGPLVDANGDVIGINTFIFTESGGNIGLGFAVPIERAKWLIRDVREFGRFRQAYSGLLFQKLSPNLMQSLGVSDPVGFVVLEVEAGSPAAKAGLRVGDIIRSINGVPLRDADTISRLVYEARVGDRLAYVAERDGRRLRGEIVLEEHPGAAARPR